MRFLANENFPGAAVKLLQSAGHDILWVRTAAPGTSDPDVLAWAARESRILLTFDKELRRVGKGLGLTGWMRRHFVSHADAGTARGCKKWTGLGRHTVSESWADVAQGRMQAAGIVKALDILEEVSAGLGAGALNPMVNLLGLEAVKEALHWRIIQTIAFAAHRGCNA